jgi:lipopolysaccharide/colanic/teichoic acid biosynthesis glycosyltransferase
MELQENPSMSAERPIYQPASERKTYCVSGSEISTDIEIRLPDEPDLPSGYRLRVGGERFYEKIKNVLDVVAALLILIVALPVILLAAALVRLTSKGTAFYTQVRLGQHGKPYVIYKLRSMYQDCERYSGIRWCTRGDQRITPVGKWLRRLHIDELPQLWNVLRGEMSLIGPRPERPELVVSLEKALPRYRDRLLVKPGLTGLAQIQLPPDTDLESVRQKLGLDRVYVYHRSFRLDLKIYAGTVLYLMGFSTRKIGRCLHLPSLLEEEAATSSAPVHFSSPRSNSNPFRTVPVLD